MTSCLLLSGCYSYVPVEQVAPGTPVRAQLPTERSVGGRVEAGDPIPVEGTVVSYGDTLVLETLGRRQFGNFREVIVADTLRISRDNVSMVEEKVFSRGRTVGLSLLVAAGALALVFGIGGVFGGESSGGGEGPDDGASVFRPFTFDVFRAVFGGA